MAIKVYKEGYMVVIDDPDKEDQLYKASSAEKQFFLAAECVHGFDGDVCWIRDEVDARLIYKGNVDQMQDYEGNQFVTKAQVESYLLQICGDSSFTSTILSNPSKIKMGEVFSGLNLSSDINLVNPESSTSIQQKDGKLVMTTDGSEDGVIFSNYIQIKRPFNWMNTDGDSDYLQFDIHISSGDQNSDFWGVGMTKESLTPLDNDFTTRMLRYPTDGRVNVTSKNNGSSTPVSTSAIDLQTSKKTIRIEHANSQSKFYYWNSTVWTQMGADLTDTMDFDANFIAYANSGSGEPITMEISNVYAYSVEQLTQYPDLSYS